MSSRHRIAFVIPVFNHEKMVAEVIEKAAAFNYPVIVVDDGSTDDTAKVLQQIEGITVLSHPVNRGKGAALLTGFHEAHGIADWAVSIDADGQHNPEDASRLIGALPDEGRLIVIGFRQGMERENVPWTSRFGRGFSNFWVRLSGGPRLSDTQSGFRVYPLPETLHLGTRCRRYQYEVEVLVKAGWADLPVREVPVRVSYAPGQERVSHFRPFIDFVRNTITFTRLITFRILIPSVIRKRQAQI